MKPLLIIVISIFSFLIANTYADVAVIVNKSNPILDISYSELVQILKAKNQYWQRNDIITLIFKPPSSKETRILIDNIYKTDYENFEKYWLLKVYKGEVKRAPKIVNSVGTVNILVSEISGAIAFVAPHEVSTHGSIKALRVDGKLPYEEGYPLK